MKYQKYMFWVFIAYIIAAYFYPALGAIAIICMLAPVMIAPFKGRYWCGNFCPRGSLYDNVLSRFSPQKSIPAFFRTKAFRTFMVVFIMTVFTVQMYYAWGDWDAMGLVFWRIISITTIVGIALGFFYHHRAWCSFCPMGTMSAWFSKGNYPLAVSVSCVSCKLCTKSCPFALEPYTGKARSAFNHPDCLKCGKCIAACPKKALSLN